MESLMLFSKSAHLLDYAALLYNVAKNTVETTVIWKIFKVKKFSWVP